MNLFRELKSVWRKSKAATVVQNLLEIQAKTGLLDLKPNELANKLVEDIWEKQPDIYHGKFGHRPHEMAVVASALANGISDFEKDDLNRNALIISLGNVLSEIEVNGRLYPFTSLDSQLIDTSKELFLEASRRVTEISQNYDSVEATESQTWEQWLDMFKLVAGKINPQLQTDEGGNNIIDFMDMEPLRRAFMDGVSPESVAIPFAEQFDINIFGQ